MIRRQPIHQRRRQQERLAAITAHKVLAHPAMVFNRPDGTAKPDSHRLKRPSVPRCRFRSQRVVAATRRRAGGCNGNSSPRRRLDCWLGDRPRGRGGAGCALARRPAVRVWASTSARIAAVAAPRRAASRPTRLGRRDAASCGPSGRCSSLAPAPRRQAVSGPAAESLGTGERSRAELRRVVDHRGKRRRRSSRAPGSAAVGRLPASRRIVVGVRPDPASLDRVEGLRVGLFARRFREGIGRRPDGSSTAARSSLSSGATVVVTAWFLRAVGVSWRSEFPLAAAGEACLHVTP
jgi:hypothetical protein